MPTSTHIKSHLLAAAAEFGTPLYVYDTAKIESQYKALQTAFSSSPTQIYYACKALTNPNILHFLRGLGSNIDTVSLNEIRLARSAGYAPEQILFTPNMISESELDVAIEQGVQINIDSLNLLEYVGEFHPDLAVGIRINPHIMAGGHQKISTGHIHSKFGISIHQLPLVQSIVNNWNINVVGMHMHNGSDILDAEVFLSGANVLFNAAIPFLDTLQYLDFGSGFKVKYRGEDMATDIQEVGSKLSALFNAFCKEHGKQLNMYIEPGKFLVSESGYFLCQVTQIKQTTSSVFIGVNSGFNHLIRPMFYDSYHTIENLSSESSKSRIYSIVGQICETDTFATNRRLPITKVGDILCIHNAGAYGHQMASNYNSHVRPAEVWIYKDQLQLIRKAESFDGMNQNIVQQF